MRVLRLETVDAMVVFDLDDAPHNAGGTRLALDVTEAEGAMLARAMTYKFAVLAMPVGGAKGLVRARPAERAAAMARYCAEVRPLVEHGRYATGPDLGTSEPDFAPLRPKGWSSHAINSEIDGTAFEDILTGFGVTVAAEAAVGGLDGRTVAIEGLGKVGGGVLREMSRRGARIVALSTLIGCVSDPRGLAADEVLEARARHGDRLVEHLGRPCLARDALFDIEADVFVPGARTGALDQAHCARLPVRAVVPAANAPYTSEGLAVLRQRDIAAHADFVCNAAAVVGYTSSSGADQQRVLDHVEDTIGELVQSTRDHPDGPYTAACAIAERFLSTWREPDGLPDGPPLG